MVGTAAEMTTRSMYVIMYAATVRPRTRCRTRLGRCGCGSMRVERRFSAIGGALVNENGRGAPASYSDAICIVFCYTKFRDDLSQEPAAGSRKGDSRNQPPGGNQPQQSHPAITQSVASQTG